MHRERGRDTVACVQGEWGEEEGEPGAAAVSDGDDLTHIDERCRLAESRTKGGSLPLRALIGSIDLSNPASEMNRTPLSPSALLACNARLDRGQPSCSVGRPTIAESPRVLCASTTAAFGEARGQMATAEKGSAAPLDSHPEPRSPAGIRSWRHPHSASEGEAPIQQKGRNN
jgi:hypothetical protein